MSDKNFEIIKAIQATGKCPPETTTVKATQMITEGLKNVPNTETRSTKWCLMPWKTMTIIKCNL